MKNISEIKELVKKDTNKQSRIEDISTATAGSLIGGGSLIVGIPLSIVLTNFFGLSAIGLVMVTLFTGLLFISFAAISVRFAKTNAIEKYLIRKEIAYSENSLLEAGRLLEGWYYYKDSYWSTEIKTEELDFKTTGLNCECKYFLCVKKLFYLGNSFEFEISQKEYDQLNRVKKGSESILRVSNECFGKEEVPTIYSLV